MIPPHVSSAAQLKVPDIAYGTAGSSLAFTPAGDWTPCNSGVAEADRAAEQVLVFIGVSLDKVTNGSRCTSARILNTTMDGNAGHMGGEIPLFTSYAVLLWHLKDSS